MGEGVVLYRPKHLANKFEDGSVTYDGAADDKSAMALFIADNRHGIAGHRTTDNAKDFKEPLVVAYYDVDYVKNIKGTNYWRNRVLKIAKDKGLKYKMAAEFDMDIVKEFMEDLKAGNLD